MTKRLVTYGLFWCAAACGGTRLGGAKASQNKNVHVEASVGKRAFLEPCVIDDECASGFCVTIAGQRRCTERCADVSGCPEDLVCKKADGRDAASPTICLVKTDRLCQTCADDHDCAEHGDLCLSSKDGNACGRDCTLSGDDGCPPGYGCVDQKNERGLITSRQCVPDTDTCLCNEDNRGQVRGCTNTNDNGTCPGLETCVPGVGYTGCTAKAAEAETCDNLDNNCNGLIDEDPADNTQRLHQACGNGHPPCVGQASCLGGVYTACTAPAPQPEICNGIDDNCDGQVDENLMYSPDSCGACGNVCAPSGEQFLVSTARSCLSTSGGFACGDITCRGDYYDVDGDISNGCEIEDDEPRHWKWEDALGSNGGGPVCPIVDGDNGVCDFSGKLPADNRDHEEWPLHRSGPVDYNNDEDWFKVAATDNALADMQIRSQLDVTNLPPENLYEVCQTTAHDKVESMPADCGERPPPGSAGGVAPTAWCNGFCCCVFGGGVVSIPLGAGSTDDSGPDDSGTYYARVRWRDGGVHSGASYQLRLCDDGSSSLCPFASDCNVPKHCTN